jgi:hypothetical protein
MKPMPSTPLVREILVILAVKFVLLFGIWAVFFSGPRPDAADPAKVGRAILDRPTVAAHPAHKD